ncbi:aminotransferase class V-fold PLP-dependent enzyme [uncultured Ilumatobacter sp.]|uniref:aminotransferase class V-fold PLP-dependent enzyme n=1 Tax=uncultured Ilumatobacter sp. TaxID=879968 RepID=UPI00374E873B
MTIDRHDAERLDTRDPLAQWRHEFVIPDPALIYLDGNSLGMTPKRTVAALRTAVEQEWAGDLITSWWEHDWLDLPLSVGDLLSPLLGMGSGEVAVHDSTTVGIFQLINVALDLAPERSAPPVIAFEPSEFPTDRYAAEGVARLRGGSVSVGLGDLTGVDVIIRSMVDYRTAEIADVAAETERARSAGAVTVWDLSHAVGVLDLDLPALGVELAVGCTYKFLNGGPGAPAFTAIAAHLHDRVTQPIWGWFGQTDQFAMDNPFEPRPGIGRLLHGTPGVLGLVGAREGISLSAAAGIGAIAAKSRQLTRFGIELADEIGLATNTPRDDRRRGGHVSILHPDATRLQAELAARKVIVDKREPDVLRLGMSPLTTRFTDVFDALTLLADLAAHHTF